MCFFVSTILIGVIGTIFHYTYDISNHNKVIGLFSAVNESTWEHIKIALTPTLLWGLIDGYIYGLNPNYFIAKFINLITIILLIPLLYYGYKTLLKKEYFVLDIIIFYTTIIISQILFYNILNTKELPFILRYISILGLFIIFGGYMLHILMPAKSIIFKDPITNKYGYKGHKK